MIVVPFLFEAAPFAPGGMVNVSRVGVDA